MSSNFDVKKDRIVAYFTVSWLLDDAKKKIKQTRCLLLRNSNVKELVINFSVKPVNILLIKMQRKYIFVVCSSASLNR